MTGTTLEDRIVVPVGRAMSDRGTARWLRRYRLVGWLEIAIGIAGFIAAVAGIAVQANSAAALLRTGARTPGVVTYYSPGDGRYNEGYFEVTYTANGVTRSGVINLTSTSASYHAGERVTVVYNRHDPGQIRTHKSRTSRAARFPR